VYVCVCLVSVETKTEWRVIESKIVFDTVQSSPAVSAVAETLETLAFAENAGKGVFIGKVGGGGPNLVCKGIVEGLGLRRIRAIGFVSATSANAIVIGGETKRRGRNFDDGLFLFFGVRQHNPVRRVREDDARLFAYIFQPLLKMFRNGSWNPE
jgi:hypothetical protein